MSSETEWVLVPREPTPEMLSAAGRLQACECGFVGDMSPMDGEEYAAMLAAAPQPPAEAQPVAWLSDWKHAANGGVTRDADIAAAWEARGEVTPLYAHPPPSAPVGVEELVRDLVREIEHNTCTHEDTRRGGSIWEICDACGAEWADDRGGKPDFKWPDCVERAHSWIAQQPAAVDGVLAGWSLRHDGELICVIGPDGRSYAGVDPDLAAQPGGSDNDR